MSDAISALTDSLARAAGGDLSGFAPDFVQLGYDIDGQPRIFDRATFWATMARCADEFEVFESEVESALPIGDELVLMAMTVHRRTHDGREFRGKLGAIFRIENGVVTRGSDLGEAGLQQYWASLGLEPC